MCIDRFKYSLEAFVLSLTWNWGMENPQNVSLSISIAKLGKRRYMYQLRLLWEHGYRTCQVLVTDAGEYGWKTSDFTIILQGRPSYFHSFLMDTCYPALFISIYTDLNRSKRCIFVLFCSVVCCLRNKSFSFSFLLIFTKQNGHFILG